MVRSRMAVRRKIRPRSRIGWAATTVAPWCLALGLVMSFVAAAGQDPAIGATRVDLTDLAAAEPADLVPSRASDGRGGFRLPGDDALVQQARLYVGDAREAPAGPDEVEPRLVVKEGRRTFPAIDRSHRGDPIVALRPTFDARLRRPGSLESYRIADVSFGDADPAAPSVGFTEVDTAPEPGRLGPMPDGMSITPQPKQATASPSAGQGSTTPHVQDGSSPAVARAVSLGSTTPARSDSTPVEIAALPKFSRGPKGLVTATATAVGIARYHPDYTALIDGAKSAGEQRCLAEAVYFEARSEPEEGQAAVAQVVLNRVTSGLYPASVCSVVFQNQQQRNACQFSFACEGHGLHITEPEAWANAVRIAREVTDGSAYVSDIGDATHYHANYVRPPWARQLTRMDAIGHHVFYKLKPGQT